MRNWMFKACFGAVLAVSLVSLGGCNRVTKHTVWRDMSPEVESLSMNHDMLKSRRARSIDTNLRTIHDDWDFLLLQERPMYMSEYPIP